MLKAAPTLATGFEAPPRGRLLQQIIDYSGPLAVAYERCIGYAKPDHSHDRVAITFARGSSRFAMRQLSPLHSAELDATTVHWMAAGERHEQCSITTVYDTLGIYPSPALLAECAAALGLAPEVTANLQATTLVLPRGPLVGDALSRYFQARIAVAPAPAALVETFGRQLVSLVMASVAGVQAPPIAESPGTVDDLGRALAFIEANLFAPLNAASICKAAHLSHATLFRRFRDALQLTPLAYVRARRLDEAEALLRTGRYSVSEVALLVGYQDLSAFSKAFKQHFHRSPSSSRGDA